MTPRQLDLFPAERPTLADDLAALNSRPCSWYEGVPKLDGLEKFLPMIRSPHDPKRTTRAERQRAGGGFDAWRSDLRGSPRVWAAAIVRLLRDRQSRTFNGIVLELTAGAYTADVAGGGKPEEGLWLAVDRGLVWWSDDAEPGVLRFAARPQSLA